jgi:hypothetical protein
MLPMSVDWRAAPAFAPLTATDEGIEPALVGEK